MALAHGRAERHRMQVRKGDNVKVLAGKDAGKSGRVLRVNSQKNTVVVEHVGIIKRHTQPFKKRQGRDHREGSGH